MIRHTILGIFFSRKAKNFEQYLKSEGKLCFGGGVSPGPRTLSPYLGAFPTPYGQQRSQTAPPGVGSAMSIKLIIKTNIQSNCGSLGHDSFPELLRISCTPSRFPKAPIVFRSQFPSAKKFFLARRHGWEGTHQAFQFQPSWPRGGDGARSPGLPVHSYTPEGWANPTW